jgi:hypothetical protein
MNPYTTKDIIRKKEGNSTSILTSDIEQIHDEMKIIRRDLEEIKAMLVKEVSPSKKELKAIDDGRKEFARGEYEEWKETRKRVVS